MVDNNGGVTTIPWTPDSGLIDPSVLVKAEVGTLLLLPEKTDDQGRALYRDDNAGLVKTLRQKGARMEFSCRKDRRTYLSEFSAGEIIANIALGVIGNFTTDVIKYATYAIQLRVAAALGRAIYDDFEREDAIRVKIARFESSFDRRIIEGLECTGPAEEVIQVIEALANQPSPSSPGDESNDNRTNR
jgi:hypothetical protein